MKTILFFLLVAALPSYSQRGIEQPSQVPNSPQNPLIKADEFQKTVQNVMESRNKRLLDEAAFLEMIQKDGVILLDARSADKFALRHIVGAINLPYTDFTEESLAKAIPKKDSIVVIYCNNNFLGAKVSFASKSAGSSLNLPTHVALADYGYKNIYELKPLLDVSKTKIPFAGKEVEAKILPPTNP